MYNAYVLFQLSFLPDTNDWQASILYPIWLKLHVCSIFFSFFGDALASKDILQWVTSGFIFSGSRHDRGCMVVGFTTTCVISAYHHKSCEFEPHSWRGILDTTLCDKVFSDLRLNIVESGVKHHKPNQTIFSAYLSISDKPTKSLGIKNRVYTKICCLIGQYIELSEGQS